MAEGASGVEVDEDSLKAVLKRLRDLPPSIRTGARREMRALGQPVINEQKAILDGPLPQGVTKTGQTTRLVQKYSKGKATGKFYVVKVNRYAETAVKNAGRSTGLREGIKAGLKFRIVSGEKRQGLEFRTTGPKVGGFNTARFWNAARFRHPVFKTGRYAYQAGEHYMAQPVLDARDELVKNVKTVVNDAVSKS